MLEVNKEKYTYFSVKDNFEKALEMGLYSCQDKIPYKDPALESNRTATDYIPERIENEQVYQWMMGCLAHGITPASKDWFIEKGRKWVPLTEQKGFTHLNTGLLLRHSLGDRRIGFKKTANYSSVFILKITYKIPRQLFFNTRITYDYLDKMGRTPSLIYKTGNSFYFYFCFNESLPIQEVRDRFISLFKAKGMWYDTSMKMLPDGSTIVPMPFGKAFEGFSRETFKRFNYNSHGGLDYAVRMMNDFYIYDRYYKFFFIDQTYHPDFTVRRSESFNKKRQHIQYKHRCRPTNSKYYEVLHYLKNRYELTYIPKHDVIKKAEDLILYSDQYKSYKTNRERNNFLRFSIHLFCHFYNEMHLRDSNHAYYAIPSNRLKNIYSNYKQYLIKFNELFSYKVRNYWNGSINATCNVFSLSRFKEVYNILISNMDILVNKTINIIHDIYRSISLLNFLNLESPICRYVFPLEGGKEGTGPP